MNMSVDQSGMTTLRKPSLLTFSPYPPCSNLPTNLSLLRRKPTVALRYFFHKMVAGLLASISWAVQQSAATSARYTEPVASFLCHSRYSSNSPSMRNWVLRECLSSRESLYKGKSTEGMLLIEECHRLLSGCPLLAGLIGFCGWFRQWWMRAGKGREWGGSGFAANRYVVFLWWL